MKIEKAAEIFRKGGFNINKIEDRYFLDNGLINYSFPQVRDMMVDEDLVDSIKWKHPLTIIKSELKIKNAYEYVLETDNYGIEKFAPKKRNDIRRSLKDCTFKKPTLEELNITGLKINQQVMAKQGRQDKYLNNSSAWRKYISSLYSEEDVFILGAYIANEMVGYIIVYNIEGIYYITEPYYDFKAAASSPTQGLIYTLVNQLLETNSKIKMLYGLESFKPLPSLNKYKQSMLFKRSATTRFYVIHPFILFFFKIIVFTYLKILKQKSIKNSRVQNIIRLYQGSRILSKTNYKLRSADL